MKSISYSRRQGGWAVISTLMAIMVGLVMLGGIFIAVNDSLNNSSLSKLQQQVATVRMNVRNVFTGDYTGLTNAVGIQVKAFSNDMVAGAAVTNPYGGAVTIQANATPTQFDIIYAAIPEDACVKLANFGRGEWMAMDINGTAIPQTGGGAVAAAAGACTAGATNTLTWTSN